LLNNRLDKLRDYKLIAELYEKTRQHDKAAETYASYVAMKDSLLADQDKYRSYSFEAEQQMNEKELAITNLESENKIVSLSRNFSIGIAGLLLLLAGVFFWQRKKTEKEKQRTVAEKKRSDQLLLNILPSEVAEELKEKGNAEARHFDEVSVLFTDFIDFTKLSEQLSPQVLVQELHECFSAFDAIMERNGLEKIKTVGDAYIAVCGLPVANKLHAEKAVQAALEIRQFMEARKKQEKVFDIRIGIHSGPVVAGIVGVKKFAYDIWGDTVNTAARMEQSSEAGKINISETTYALVKDKFSCIHRGKIAAKGKGEIDMYFVEA
jgi:class 3 adenylate cyclase